MKSRERLRHQKAHSPCSFANFTILIHFDIVHMHMNMCSAHFWHASWTYPLILKLLEAFVLAMRVEAWTWTVEINKALGYTQTPATSVLIYWDSSTKAIYQGPIPTLKMQQIHSIPFRHDSIVEFVVLAEVKCEASFDGSAVCQTYTQQYGGWLWHNWNTTLKYYNCHVKHSESWLVLPTPKQWKSTVWTRISCQAVSPTNSLGKANCERILFICDTINILDSGSSI